MCDLETITIYTDNFSCYLLVFLLQPIIEIEITLKSIKGIILDTLKRILPKNLIDHF